MPKLAQLLRAAPYTIDVPVFSPFIGLRYSDRSSSEDVVAPPYDVVSDAQRLALEARHPHNSVRLDFPHGKTDPGAYEGVAALVRQWENLNVLLADSVPTFTVYRMTAVLGGRTTTTTGVLGALTLEEPGSGDILPHEQTTPKDKADRLSLLRSARLNTSPIWGLSLSSGLGALCAELTHRAADFAATDEGVLHEAWIVADTAAGQALSATVASAPVVIADGHHRLETALAYQHERSVDDEGAKAILAYLVELAPEELEIRAIHRLIDAPLGVDVLDVLRPFFTLAPTDPATATTVDQLPAKRSLAVVTPAGTWLAAPRPEAFDRSVELDTERLVLALASNPDIAIRYHHDPRTVIDAVHEGSASAGVFVRPVQIDQIRNVAQTRTRMPPKATFFFPKPRTGVVFRPLDVPTRNSFVDH